MLLLCIGSKGCDVCGTFDFAQASVAKEIDVVLSKFESSCQPKKYITMSQHKFFTHKQQEGQPLSKFATLKDSLVKDMAICEVLDNKLREQMLHTSHLNLETVIKLGHAAEKTQKQHV